MKLELSSSCMIGGRWADSGHCSAPGGKDGRVQQVSVGGGRAQLWIGASCTAMAAAPQDAKQLAHK
jgi:hypothetical protein